MLMANFSPLGVVSQHDYWSSARSGGAQGLGIVPQPAEINRSLTGLGVVPNDFQLAYHRQYLPYMHGWIRGKDRIHQEGNLGGGGVAAAMGMSDEDIAAIVTAEKLKAKMAVVSGVAIALMAAIGIYSLLSRS